jgi:anti-sigma B factor antagonist
MLESEACTIDVTRSGRSIVVAVSGEIDLAEADAMLVALESVLSESPQDVTIDLVGLEFIDSFGISRLVLAQQRARTRGVPLRLVRPRPSIRRVFVISGLLAFLNVE